MDEDLEQDPDPSTSGPEFAKALGELIDGALKDTPPLLILKILGSVQEDLRALQNRLEIQGALEQLSDAMAKASPQFKTKM
jgi:hypothetical protein